jgi:hypothetical protein
VEYDGTKPLAEIIASIRDRSIVDPSHVADALEEIDRRLRVLEPCAASGGGPHAWCSDDNGVRRCHLCKVPR